MERMVLGDSFILFLCGLIGLILFLNFDINSLNLIIIYLFNKCFIELLLYV